MVKCLVTFLGLDGCIYIQWEWTELWWPWREHHDPDCWDVPQHCRFSGPGAGRDPAPLISPQHGCWSRGHVVSHGGHRGSQATGNTRAAFLMAITQAELSVQQMRLKGCAPRQGPKLNQEWPLGSRLPFLVHPSLPPGCASQSDLTEAPPPPGSPPAQDQASCFLSTPRSSLASWLPVHVRAGSTMRTWSREQGQMATISSRPGPAPLTTVQCGGGTGA